MKILTNELVTKYGLDKLTLTATRNDRGKIAIAVTPWSGWVLSADEEETYDLVMRCMSDGVKQAIITASVKGIETAIGFDDQLISFGDLKALMQNSFEALRAYIRQIEQVFNESSENDRAVATKYAKAIGLNDERLLTAMPFVPVDRIMDGMSLGIMLCRLLDIKPAEGEIVSSEASVVLCAPTIFPDAMAEELNAIIRERFLALVTEEYGRLREAAPKAFVAFKNRFNTKKESPATPNDGVGVTETVTALEEPELARR